MPETTAPSPLQPHSLTLKEATIFQQLDSSSTEIPRIRQVRSDLLKNHLADYVKQSLSNNKLPEEPFDEKKIAEVQSYFQTKDKELGMTPLERIAQIYEHLDPPSNPSERKEFEEAIKDHMFLLGERAFDQHYDNPEQYVSHGFDHSIRVADYSMQIVKNFPEILDTIAQEYSITHGQAKFLIENATLFHDCGYCRLARGSNKVAHSVGSLRIIADDKVHTPMKKLLAASNTSLTEDKLYKIMDDLEGAILFHNADKIDKGYDAKLQIVNGHWLGLADKEDVIDVLKHYERWSKEDPRGDWYNPKEIVIRVKSQEARDRIEADLKEEFQKKGLSLDSLPKIYWENPEISTTLPDQLLYYGRKTDLEPGDKRIGLEYREADTFGYSLLALLRVGDNLDLLQNRFSPIQKHPAFANVYRSFFGRADLKDTGVKESLIERSMQNYPDLSQPEKEKIKELGVLLDAESFKHFGGCEALKAVVFRPSQIDSNQAEIAIYVDEPLFKELQNVKFKERSIDKDGTIKEDDMTIAEYQIWRLKDAVKVNLHGGSPIALRILNSEGDDITQNTFLQTIA